MALYTVLFIFIIFASAIETEVPLVNYWDELFTIVFLLYGLYKNRFKLKSVNIKNWIWLVLLIFIGLVGNCIHPGLQGDSITIVKDVFAISKFFIIAYSLQDVVISEQRKRKIIKLTAKISRILIIATTVVAFVGYFIEIGVYTGEIRLVNCFKFVFSVPTFFVSSYVMLAAVLIAESTSKNRIYLILDCILLFMSQRTKGYGAIVLIVLMLLLGDQRIRDIAKKAFSRVKFSVSKMKLVGVVCLLGIIAFLLGKSKIEEYLFYGIYAARPAMYIVGFKIANDFFPFGSGFGTFASSLSTESYSKIYGMYGISNVLGLVEGDAVFAADVFWPCIYGQFGILGFSLYALNMWKIIKRQLFCEDDAFIKLSLFFIWFYAFIASTSEAYFTNSSGVQMALICCLFLGIKSYKKGLNHRYE